jgi:hypothetical protein
MSASSAAPDTTHKAITEACEPVIRAWLETDEYRRSRRRTVAQAVRRELEAPASYKLERARKTLDSLAGELGPIEADHLASVLSLLEGAAAGLDREAMAD